MTVSSSIPGSLRILNLHFEDPFHDLLCDEVLLDRRPSRPVIRFWEARSPFVVLGLGNRPEREVDLAACRRSRIPVFRRTSGGGTVLQAPGCLNYALVMPLDTHPRLGSVTAANASLMERHRQAIGRRLAAPLQVRGHTDLVLEGRKCSGNAQRRRRDALLFHGTFLHDCDPGLMDRFLLHPSRSPEYRAGRSHSGFVRNLPLTRETIIEALCHAWEADRTAEIPGVRADVLALAARKEGDPRWCLPPSPPRR